MTIAVDVMGGDHGITIPIQGALDACEESKSDIILVGDQDRIQQSLDTLSYDKNKISIQHASQQVEMDESPAVSLRLKKDSSIRVALNLVKGGTAQAMVSPGNTGAVMATSKFVLKTIKGIDRPAIATTLPSLTGNFVLLDAGANSECKPEFLAQFGIMGDAYAKCTLNKEEPKVYLLNNGEEESKGTTLLKDAYRMLQESTLNFCGNIEGKSMYKGDTDVVVCDGFTGNITLKVAEGTFDFVKQALKQEVLKSGIAKLGYLLMKPAFNSLKKRADYKEVGGAPLLGVNGIVMICHGSSSAYEIKNAILHAKKCIDLNLNDVIRHTASQNSELSN